MDEMSREFFPVGTGCEWFLQICESQAFVDRHLAIVPESKAYKFSYLHSVMQ
jgi:hypothetical protein